MFQSSLKRIQCNILYLNTRLLNILCSGVYVYILYKKYIIIYNYFLYNIQIIIIYDYYNVYNL